MKRGKMALLTGLIGLLAAQFAGAWEYCDYGVVYNDPIVVQERVYVPPVVRYYEPEVVETSSFGNRWFSVNTTRVIDPGYGDSTVIYDSPRVVRSYGYYGPTFIAPRYYRHGVRVISPRHDFRFDRHSYRHDGGRFRRGH
ncbi:MAG: hypothetical protein WC975_14610 [Phycisphaerae bacterium]